jgi:hypothetical protein
MSVPRVVDGETYADSTYMNLLVDAANGRGNVLTGAAADGVTDDTDAILAFVDDLQPSFAGSLYSTNGARPGLIPPGIYGISDEIVITNWNSFVGSGAQNTVFKALSADARIRVAASYCEVGSFTFDGNNLANVGVYTGECDGLNLHNVAVVNCAGNGFETHNTQNAFFYSLRASQNARHGFVLDDGSGSIFVLRLNSNGNGRHQVYVTQSDSVASGYDEPTQCVFTNGMFEYGDTDDYATVHVDAGANIIFDNTNFTPNSATTTEALLKVSRLGGTETQSSVIVRNAHFLGDPALSVGMEVTGAAASIQLDGYNSITGLDIGFKIAGSGAVRGTWPFFNAVDIPFSFSGGASMSGNVSRLDGMPWNYAADATSGTIMLVTVDGEVGERLRVLGNGQMLWSDGTAFGASDTNLYRTGAGRLHTDGKLTAFAGIGVGNSAAGTSLGSVTKKIEIFDSGGNSLGYLPVYDAIT